MYIGMMLLHNSEIIIDMQNNPKISQPKLTLLSTLTTILYYNYIASNCKQSKYFFYCNQFNRMHPQSYFCKWHNSMSHPQFPE